MSKETHDLLVKCSAVLESNTHFSESLRGTILSFYAGIEDHQKPLDRLRVMEGGRRLTAKNA